MQSPRAICLDDPLSIKEQDEGMRGLYGAAEALFDFRILLSSPLTASFDAAFSNES